jgi:hypothetical protein
MNKQYQKKKSLKISDQNTVKKATVKKATVKKAIKSPEIAILKPRIQRKTLLLKLAGNRKFVGSMKWMLPGCFTAAGFISLLFVMPDLGRAFEKIAYFCASFIPKTFIPPDTYIPGIFSIPILLLIIAGFTFYGYKKGSNPPPLEAEPDIRSSNEKLFEFVFIYAICLALVYYNFSSDHPELGFVQIITHPFMLILFTIITLGLSFYVFSSQQSIPFLLFVLKSALAIGFVLFLLGLIVETLVKSFLYALNH